MTVNLSPDGLEYCLGLLESMPTGRDQDAKWAQIRQIYVIVLSKLFDPEARAACEWAAESCEWRPAPAILKRIAARLASPYPNADEAYAEIMDKANRLGLMAKPDPRNPNCYDEGPPDCSHPLVAQTIAHCGGWEMICTGEAGMQMGMKKQVDGAYPDLCEKWELEVAAQLSLPPAQRSRRYFGRYPQYLAAAPPSPLMDELLAIEAPRKQIEPPIVNPDVLKMLRGSLKSIAAPKRSATAQTFDRPEAVLTKEKRAELEAEAKEITARVERMPTDEEVAQALEAARQKKERRDERAA